MAAHLNVTMIQKRGENGVELYISDDKELYKSLFEKKESIDSESGLVFNWQELPEKKTSKIIVTNLANF